MAKQFWLNLPVKDVSRSKAFFSKLDFKFNDAHSTSTSACMLLGEKDIVLMLFEEPTFKKFTQEEIPGKGCEVLLSIDANSKDEVDELVEKAVASGGTSNHKPYPLNGPMYGAVFSDPDGHKWNVLYMDTTKM